MAPQCSQPSPAAPCPLAQPHLEEGEPWGGSRAFIRVEVGCGEPQPLPAASLAGLVGLFLPSLLENRSNSSKPNGEIPREFCFLLGLPRDGRVLPHAPTLPLLGSPVTFPRCPCGALPAKGPDPVPQFPHPDPMGQAGSWGNAEEKGLRGEEGPLGALWDTASLPAPVIGDGHRERAESGALSHCGERGVLGGQGGHGAVRGCREGAPGVRLRGCYGAEELWGCYGATAGSNRGGCRAALPSSASPSPSLPPVTLTSTAIATFTPITVITLIAITAITLTTFSIPITAITSPRPSP